MPTGGVRKVALIGGAPTVREAPWDDPSWEIWAHTSVGRFCRRVDRWFELHPRAVYTAETVGGAKHGRRDWYGWLKARPEPVYLQEATPEIPSSVTYPKARILAEFPRYLTSTVAWMIALAITEGVHTIGLWGIHFESGSEYEEQRAGCEFWLGLAMGRGIQVKLPESCPLLKQPAELYGYESHTPEKYVERLKTFKQEIYTKRTANFDASKLVPLTAADATDLLRTGVFPTHDNTLRTLVARMCA